MSSKFENILRFNRKSLFATLGGFETSGAFFQGIILFEAQWGTLIRPYFKNIQTMIVVNKSVEIICEYLDNEKQEHCQDFHETGKKHLECNNILKLTKKQVNFFKGHPKFMR